MFFRLVDIYKKVDKFSDALHYFMFTRINFKNSNTQALYRKLNKIDQEMFQFSMAEFSLQSYLVHYAVGLRIYLVKDPLETLPAAKRKYAKLRIAHYVLMAFLLLILVYFVRFVLNFIL